jgi:hypothetical protein
VRPSRTLDPSGPRRRKPNPAGCSELVEEVRDDLDLFDDPLGGTDAEVLLLQQRAQIFAVDQFHRRRAIA